MLVDQVDRRERALAREAHGRPRPPRRPRPRSAAQRSSVNQPCCDAVALEAQDRILLLPVGGGERLAVLARVALVVAAQPVGQALEQERPAAVARRGEVARRRHPTPRATSLPSTVSRSTLVGRDDVAHALDVRVRRARRELREAVVLADEDQRQLPERREVDGLVEVAGLHRAVAEEHDRDRVVAAQPRRQRAARARSGCCRRPRRSRP